MGILIGIIALFIFYKVYSKSQRENRINQRFSNFSIANFFTPHESYVSADLNSAIAVDKDNRLIGLQDSLGQCNFYDERYIVTSQIVLNEQTYERHPFIRVWGSYLIGKWIGGQEVGKLAALTSRVNVDKEINSIKLKITVNDLTKPNYTITFLDGKTSKSQQDNALQQAEYWDSLIKVFMHIDNRNRIPFD